ncbi:MAG: hypothetical protein QOD71_3181 [Thermoleophilaceae bacterium]|jgi:hypothetical protein|nr:hypothetical protein [Thermoleophilaceae bacterium]
MRCVALTITVLALALVSGCGGGGDSTPAPQQQAVTPKSESQSDQTTATDTLTHAQFVQQTDAICKRGNDRQDREYSDRIDQAEKSADYDRLADLTEAALNDPRNQQETRELAAVQPPPEDASAYREYIGQNAQIVALERRLVVALRDQNDDEIARLVKLINRVRDQRTTSTAAWGAQACGS